jgi:hypothetical protein
MRLLGDADCQVGLIGAASMRRANASLISERMSCIAEHLVESDRLAKPSRRPVGARASGRHAQAHDLADLLVVMSR